MPNTGRPSPGCYLCRKRRVKCDLDPRGCFRCAKIGKGCSGYRTEQDLLFHNQNQKSFEGNPGPIHQKKKIGIKSLSEECEILSVRGTGTTHLSLGHVITSQTPPALFQPLKEHWGAYGIPIVLHQFSALVDGCRFYGYLDFLPDLYRESNEGSCLSSATSVVAKAYITNLSHAPPDKKQAVQIYGRALRSTNAALQDPMERAKDSTIIAVWLLGIYEILVSSYKKSFATAPEAFHMHSEGMATLLRIRGSSQFSTKRGRNLFWMMYLFIVSLYDSKIINTLIIEQQIHCLAANVEGPPQSLYWFDLLRPQLSESDKLAFAVSEHTYKISVLCPKILCFIKQSCTDCEEVKYQSKGFFAEIDALHRDVQAWNTNVTFQATDLSFLHIFNMLRAAFLKLQHFNILLISYTISHSNSILLMPSILLRRQRCIEVIQSLSSEILRSVPQALGDQNASPDHNPGCWASALRLVWPLVVVSWIPDVLRIQREESQQALQRIGKQMGIGFALNCEPPPGRFVNTEVSNESDKT